jgi:putative serine protease PepD
MAQITVRWRGGERTFESDRPVRVGRAAECDVLVLDERVSRNPHLELRFEHGTWVLEDKSSGGTFSNGQRIQTVSIPEAHTFNLGAPDGPEVTVTPVKAEEPAAPRAPATPAAPAAPAAPATPAADPGAALLEEAARLDAMSAESANRMDAMAAESAAAAPTVVGPAPGAGPNVPPVPTIGPPPGGPPPPGPPSGGPPPPLPPTLPPPGPPPMAPPPGGVPSFDPSLTVSLDDRALRLTYNEKEMVIPAGYAVTIGRDPSSNLVIDSQIVSRQHARFIHNGTDWVLEDLGSTRGTFVDGKRLRGPYSAHGVFEVSLGDDTAGEKVRVVTAGEHTVSKSRTPLLIAIAALVIALIGIGAVAVSQDEDTPAATANNDKTDDTNDNGTSSDAPNTEQQLTDVKASTVQIDAYDGSDYLWSGSGTVITDQGHILTNAHVADPQAASLEPLQDLIANVGSEDTPDHFEIWVAPEEDKPVEPRYLAEWVASSATQDASIIQITQDINTGEPVDSIPLEPTPIGSSADLHAGAGIHSLGYPANAQTLSISVKRGEVISFISGDEFEAIGGDSRKVMNTDAVLGGGSSGGPVIRHGEIVGINFTMNTEEGLDRGWVVPISEISELLAKVGL